jgi:O-antigen biosynthesis protein WbqV
MPFSGEVLPLATLAFVPLCIFVFVGSGLYRGLWRYASMQDLLTLTRAASLLLLLFYLGLFIIARGAGVPRSVPVIQWLLLLAMLGAPRFAYRLLKDRRLGLDFSLAGLPRVPVLIIGANDSAELFIRESRRNPAAPYHVVGLTDDNPARRGQQVHGIRIYGGSDQLTKIVGKLQRKGREPQRIVLADAKDGKALRALLAECNTLGLPLSRLPQTLELKSSSDQAEIRPIEIEDLLHRSQKVQDLRPIEQLVTAKTILITGAGGTIGGEITRQIASFKPTKIILLEHAEWQLYTIERALADAPHDFTIVPVLGDVRDTVLLDKIFAEHQPQLVFHAAALKHVPLAEQNPEITISVNVLGTKAVAEASAKHKAEAMVLISTDKAVHPSSVMGASKRLAEKVISSYSSMGVTEQGDARSGGQRSAKWGMGGLPPSTQFIAVRFGNVLGSTGSVVPRFQQQLAARGPLTVTHPDMTRYFMTIREAVELVLQSAALGVSITEQGDAAQPWGTGGGFPHKKDSTEQGEARSGGQRSVGGLPPSGVYVLDMGEPVKIDDLARQMIQLAGLSVDKIGITYTGLRPGEKMHEALFYDEEALTPTPHASIRLAQNDATLPDLATQLDALEQACAAHNPTAALALLQQLVPEYNNS